MVHTCGLRSMVRHVQKANCRKAARESALGCAAANHDLDSFRLTAENRAEVLDALREFVVHYDYDKIWAEQP